MSIEYAYFITGGTQLNRRAAAERLKRLQSTGSIIEVGNQNQSGIAFGNSCDIRRLEAQDIQALTQKAAPATVVTIDQLIAAGFGKPNFTGPQFAEIDCALG